MPEFSFTGGSSMFPASGAQRVFRLPAAPDPAVIAIRAIDIACGATHPMLVADRLNVRVVIVPRSMIIGGADGVAIGDYEVRLAEDLACGRRVAAEMLGLVLVRRWVIQTHAPHAFAALFADELLSRAATVRLRATG